MHLSQPLLRFRAAAAVRLFVSLTALAIGTSLLRAQVFTEIGDAGQTPGTAQNTGLSQPLSGTATIFGTIGPTNPNDVDVFRIQIVNPQGFSATTVNPLTGASGGPGGLDTQLFLFDSGFHPVYANDDANGLTLQSTLPGNSIFLSSLAPGIYYLAISLSGNNPVNSVNQLVFTTGGGDTTAIRSMASGINPTTWADFNGGTSFNQTGAYQINITNVPESGSTVILMIVALAGVAVVRRRWAA